MPAATRAPKKQAKQAKEHVKGLESEEALDQILQQYAEKRSQQILNETNTVVHEASHKVDLGTKAERRARRKELQARSGQGMMQTAEQGVDDNQDLCLRCGQFTCRLTRWIPTTNPEGAFECMLCTKPGLANAGVWHCTNCNWDAHISCYNKKKEAEMADNIPVLTPSTDADCPKPSLAWDPLALTGPHMAIGAGAGLRSVGEVALD